MYTNILHRCKEIKIGLYFLILFAVITNSCTHQTETLIHLRQCAKNKTDNVFLDLYNEKGLDLYSMVAFIEADLQHIGALNDLSKNSYINLIEAAKQKNPILTNSSTINKYSMIGGLIIIDVISNCPYEIIYKNEDKLKSNITNQFKLIDQLLASGYDYNVIFKYINHMQNDDFKHIENRAPIIVMLLFLLSDRPEGVPK